MLRYDASNSTTLTPTGAHPFCIRANEHYPPHKHPYHELIIIQRGRLRARIAAQDYVANPGDILLYSSGTVHEEWAQNAEPVITWVCRFLWEDLKPDEVVFCHDTHGHVQEEMTLLALEYIDSFTLRGRPETRLTKLQTILAELSRLTLQEPQATIHRVRAYMNEHIHEPFTLDDLVVISGISKSYLVRQYRAVTGRTPMEDARFLRVEEARRLLLHTSLPLYEIAPKVGIPDVCRLSRLLKTCLGTGARELRQGGKREPRPDTVTFIDVHVHQAGGR